MTWETDTAMIFHSNDEIAKIVVFRNDGSIHEFTIVNEKPQKKKL